MGLRLRMFTDIPRPTRYRRGDTAANQRRLEHLRRLGKIYDELETMEAFRTSPFMKPLSEEERETQTREGYGQMLGKYRPFLERVQMEDEQREKALTALRLEGTENMGPKALQDYVLRVARKVERTVARAIGATQAERTVLRKESAKRQPTVFTEVREPKERKNKRREVDVRDEQDVEEVGGDRLGLWEELSQHVNSEEDSPAELLVGEPGDEPEDPIKVAFADERRKIKSVGGRIKRVGTLPAAPTIEDGGAEHAPHASDVDEPASSGGEYKKPPTIDAEFEVVEEEVQEEPEPEVDLGEPTEPIDVLKRRVREAVASKYRRHLDRPQDEVRSWGAIVEGKASALKTMPGAEVFGIVNEKPRSNEDRVVISKDGLRFAAIDGMGGHGDGDKAAEALARHLIVESEDSLPLRAEQAYRELKEMRDGQSIARESGACFAAVELGMEEDKVVATIAHAGDVKALVVGKDGAVRFATRDFSLVQSMVDEKHITEDAALYHPMRNMVTSSVTASEFPLPPGDGQEQLNALVGDKRRALDVRNAIERLRAKGLSEEAREALYKEIITFYREGKYKGSGMGLSVIELKVIRSMRIRMEFRIT